MASASWEYTPRAIKIFRDTDKADPTAHLELSCGLSESGRLRWAFNSVGAALRTKMSRLRLRDQTQGKVTARQLHVRRMPISVQMVIDSGKRHM